MAIKLTHIGHVDVGGDILLGGFFTCDTPEDARLLAKHLYEDSTFRFTEPENTSQDDPERQ